MEVREELKEIIEKAKEAAIAAGELPEGDYALYSVWKCRNPRNLVIIPPMRLCSGREQRTKHRA